MSQRKGYNVIINRIETFLGKDTATKNEIFYYLNTFRNGTTPNELNRMLDKKQFEENNGKWKVIKSPTLED